MGEPWGQNAAKCIISQPQKGQILCDSTYMRCLEWSQALRQKGEQNGSCQGPGDREREWGYSSPGRGLVPRDEKSHGTAVAAAVAQYYDT